MGRPPRKSGRVQREWSEVARRWREALRLLDFDTPNCLPGERDGADCGGSEVEHAYSYLGALLAVLEHKLEHVSPAARVLVESAHDAAAVELAMIESIYPCERDHVHGD